ncbi:ABC transporter permease [Candidatus Woesearchaeota archaeon]|nr:ABC transporter permease [Candidatus Woesearchaeota archaeon]
MITKENFNYALRNLFNRKVRSSLTILSIFVGIATIFIFLSFGFGLQNYITQLSTEIGVDKLFVQAKGIGAPGTDPNFKLTDDDLSVIEKTRGITQAIGMPYGSGQVKKDKKIVYQYMIGMPVNSNKDITFALEFFTVKLLEGRNLQNGDNNKIVLGYSYRLPNKIFEKALKIGDKLEINGEELKIVGFFEELGNPSDDANIYMTIDTFDRLTNATETNYAFLVGRVNDPADMSAIKDRVERELRKSRGLDEGKEDFFVASFDEYIESFSGATNIVNGFILLIALISVFVSMINTANTMFTSILERTKEIGVLKAIGAKNSEILIIFLLESSILGMVAGIIGVLIGYLISSAGGNILKALGWGFLQPAFPSSLFIGCILFATLVGTISGMIPAYNASKQKPVDSLRYE